jgi:Do/DeqQ family serine protease
MRDYSVNHSSPSNPKPSKKPIAYLGLVLLGMGMGIGGTYAVSNPQGFARLSESAMLAPQSAVETPAAIAGIPAPSNFVVDVVKETGPAVVRINSERKVETEAPEMPNDSFFRDFFGSQVPSFPHGQSQIQRGTGSGFIVSDNGQILTNAHVVAGADEVTVTLKDGRTLKGRVLGSDPTTDVAVVKIEADHLPVVKVGKSNQLQVGEWAIAIGNPLGLDNTVTTGIISATGRSSSQIGVGDKRVEFIQTDAAINPGNSGGPLLNANGEVIGMNTAIIQNAQGIGFAIPIQKAQQISKQIIAKGKVEHPFLGIQMVEVTPELKQKLQESNGVTLKADQGVVIMKVLPNSPANLAGVESGDVIQGVNGQSIKSPGQVQDLVENTAIGSELPLQVSRDGKDLTLKVKVGVLPNVAQSE